jgi:hypothetical protein
MFAFEKQSEDVARDLIEAILGEGYYVQVRCIEDGDLLQTPTADPSKAMEEVFCTDAVMVEAVSINQDNYKRNTAASFLFIGENGGPDCIADYSVSNHSDRIYQRAVA